MYVCRLTDWCHLPARYILQHSLLPVLLLLVVVLLLVLVLQLLLLLLHGAVCYNHHHRPVHYSVQTCLQRCCHGLHTDSLELIIYHLLHIWRQQQQQQVSLFVCLSVCLSVCLCSMFIHWVARWCSGTAPDSRSADRGFNSWPLHCRATTLGKLFTPMCLCSPSSISWCRARAFMSTCRMWQPMAWVQWTRGVL